MDMPIVNRNDLPLRTRQLNAAKTKRSPLDLSLAGNKNRAKLPKKSSPARNKNRAKLPLGEPTPPPGPVGPSVHSEPTHER